MMAVVERRHARFPLLLVPLGLLLLARWSLGRRTTVRVVAIGGGLLLIAWVNTRPFVAQLGRRLTAPVLVPSDIRPLAGLGRAHGALFRADDAELVRATAAMIQKAEFRNDDTWLDFANVPALYYLFHRDCPVRFYEVPFYESKASQLEVIEAIRRNPSVRAVLISSGLASQAIDGIPNAARAPLVAEFVRQSFAPFYSTGPISFWVRTSESTRRLIGDVRQTK
jgi:hypothetical protein